MEQPGVMAPAAGVAPGAQPPVQAAPTTQPAAGQPAGTPPGGAPPAGQPGSPGQPGQPAAAPAQPDQQVQVPVTVLQAVRQENQNVKAQLEQMQQQLAIYRANMGAFQPHPMAPQPPPAAPTPPADPFAGMRDDDVMTVADLKKIVQAMPSPSAPMPEIQEVRAMAMKLEVAQADPQYEQTIRTFLPEVLAADPTLRQAIVASPNPLKTALSLARTNPRFMAARQQAGGGPGPGQPTPSPLDQLALILQNLEKPGNPGQFGAAPIGAGGASMYANMSDADFDAKVRQVKGGL